MRRMRWWIPALLVVTPADEVYLAERAAVIARLDGVAGQLSPPQRTRAAMQFMVPVAGEGTRPTWSPRSARSWRAVCRLTVLVTGPARQVADLIEAFGGIDGLLLVVAGAVVAAILVVVYRSPVLPLLVLVSAVFALGVASFVVYQLAKHDVLTLNGQSQGSSSSWCSARQRTTRCCWCPGFARSCGRPRTGWWLSARRGGPRSNRSPRRPARSCSG